MTRIARFINPDNLNLTEVHHDNTLSGKGTRKSKLRIVEGVSVVIPDGFTVFGNGTHEYPLTIISEEYIILDEEGLPVLDEEGNFILSEDYSPFPSGIYSIDLATNIEVSNSVLELNIGDGAGGVIVDNNTTKEGLKYADDYSDDFIDNSLVSKKYVDDAIFAALNP